VCSGGTKNKPKERQRQRRKRQQREAKVVEVVLQEQPAALDSDGVVCSTLCSTVTEAAVLPADATHMAGEGEAAVAEGGAVGAAHTAREDVTAARGAGAVASHGSNGDIVANGTNAYVVGGAPRARR